MPPAWSMMRMRLDAGLAQVGAGGHAGDAAAEDDDVDLVDDGITLGGRREGVVAVLGEVLVVAQVADVRPAGDQPLVALGQVLGPDGLGVVVLGVEWWRRHGEVRGPSRCEGRPHCGMRSEFPDTCVSIVMHPAITRRERERVPLIDLG